MEFRPRLSQSWKKAMNSTPPHTTRQYTRSTGVKLFEADSHIPIWQSLQKGLKTRDTVFMPGKAQFR